jgi:hypothetical protein
VVIDWPGAYVHAHLGDLYTLLREADRQGLARHVGTAALPAIFAHEAGLDLRTVTDLMRTGGMCWLVLTLRWLLEAGIQVIPQARGWIGDLVAEYRSLADL